MMKIKLITLMTVCFCLIGLESIAQNEFITTWQTDNAGISAATEITIPTTGIGYNYDIDWDNDGTFDEFGLTGDVTHDFVVAGTYTIRIQGDFPRIYFNNGGDKEKLTSVDQWGIISWTSFEDAFNGCTDLNILASDSPDLTLVTSLVDCFRGASSMNEDISNWNVSTIINFARMFKGATLFNQDIGGWNTSSAQFLGEMFIGASSFDQNIGNWDVSNVSNAFGMFSGATLSTANYDSLLIGWNAQLLLSGANFSGGNSMYCSAWSERDNMINIDTWNITDGGMSCPGEEFITTWQTDNAGTSTSTEITIPTTGTGYNYHVDWDNDGTFDEFNLTGDVTHDFGTAGTYTVRIAGDFPRIFFSNGGDRLKFLDVSQWGTIGWTSMSSAFRGCENLNFTATDVPDLSGVTSFYKTFQECSTFNSNIDAWDMSNATTIYAMFWKCYAFNQPLNSWNTSNVDYMSGVFNLCSNFNQPLDNWDLSKVTSIYGMFYSCGVFNQDISGWNTQKVENMGSTFRNASAFDQNIGAWQVDSLTNANNMFNGVTLSTANYDSILIGWNSQVLQSGVAFSGGNSQYCSAYADRAEMLAIDTWTITDGGTTCSNQEFITTWKTDNTGTSGTTEITIPTTGTGYNYHVDWDNDGTFDEFNLTGDVTHDFGVVDTFTIRIAGDFPRIYFNGGGDKNKILSVDQWGAIAWENMQAAFWGCSNMNVLATDAPDLSGVINMQTMFRNCTSFDADISAWDVSTVENFIATFRNCPIFNSTLNTWTTSSAIEMRLMLADCDLFNQDLSNFNTTNVIDMDFMFQNAIVFDQDLSSWDVGVLQTADGMFDGVTLSITNYDTLLIAWNAQVLQSGVTFSGGNSQYCSAWSERENMINTDTWIITDGGMSCPGEEFITTWKTNNTGTSGTTEITIPTNGAGYSYHVDWDNDGTFDEFNLTGDVTHDFGVAGTYTIRIAGDFPQIFFDDSGDKEKLISIDQWGSNAWTSMASSFRGCSNMDMTATDDPDLSNVVTLNGMFRDCSSFNGDVSNWDVSTVSNFASTFRDATAFNGDVSVWVMSNAISISYMFEDCPVFNQDISGWDVSSVEVMRNTFYNAIAFNQDLSSWNVAETSIFALTFYGATAFDQSLATWDISNATTASLMLSNSGLSIANYDATLIGFNALPAPPVGILFGGIGLHYCVAGTERANLISTHTWSINDAGLETISPTPDVVTLADVTAICDINLLTAPTATDNCTAGVIATNDAVFPITEGTTIVTWTYTDDNGNFTTQDQNVIVDDVTAPLPGTPTLADIIDVCDITNPLPPPPVLPTDECASFVSITNDASFPITEGTTVITWTYDDGHGNTTTQTQNVIIDDITAPVSDSTSLMDFIAECSASPVAPTGTDECATVVTVTPDVTFPITAQGTTAVTWTFDDGHGNTSTQTQNVILTDVTNPTASNPNSLNVQCVGDIPAASPSYVTDEADNCSGVITVAFVSEVSDGLTCPETITRTFSVTDEVGNSIDVTQTITVQDLTAPLADNGSLTAEEGFCDITLTAPTATDNCSGSLTAIADVAFPINTLGTTTVTWTYVDDCGNTSTQTQDVIINAIDVTTSMANDNITILANNNPGSGVTFQWIDCLTGDPIAGETNHNYTPTYGSDFAVIVTEDGCSDTSACVTSVVGIDALEASNLNIYPNPSSNGIFYIKSDLQVSKLKVYDVLGRRVKVNYNPDNGVVNAENLAPGKYTVKLIAGGTLQIRELIIVQN